MPIKCRDMIEEDHDRWYEMYIDYACPWGEMVKKTYLDEVWEILIHNKAIWNIVAVNEQGILTGFANTITSPCTYSLRTVGYIQNFYVDPEYRRQSIGKEMMAYIHEHAQKNDWYKVSWKTMPDNIDAQAFYDQIASKSEWIYYELETSDRGVW